MRIYTVPKVGSVWHDNMYTDMSVANFLVGAITKSGSIYVISRGIYELDEFHKTFEPAEGY